VQLGSLARAHGVRLVAFDELDSTNDEAKRLIASNELGPLWIVAARQTSGRGRLGRNWISTSGNLHASLILSGDFSPALAPQLGFVAGLATLRAAEAVTGRSGVALKWPNDLLFDRAKLGGVLLEGVSRETGDARQPFQLVAVIGVGVNCAAAPADLPYKATALSSVSTATASADALFEHLSDKFVEMLDLWNNGSGFPKIRELWLAAAAGLHESISVTTTRGETLHGRFVSIDDTGRLILEEGNTQRLIDAGDVFLAHAPPSNSADVRP
jgi:biotin-[acetyl-CoA-carboxylase] ligase BirA-like protein